MCNFNVLYELLTSEITLFISILKVHNLSILKTGVLGSIPFLIRFPFAIGFGFAGDFVFKKTLKTAAVRKGFSVFCK